MPKNKHESRTEIPRLEIRSGLFLANGWRAKPLRDVKHDGDFARKAPRATLSIKRAPAARIFPRSGHAFDTSPNHYPKRGVGGVYMKTAAEYRAMAEECIKWAGQAYTDEVRESYLQLARIWLDTASRLNGVASVDAEPYESSKAEESAG
jgi:hypothetical protein